MIESRYCKSINCGYCLCRSKLTICDRMVYILIATRGLDWLEKNLKYPEDIKYNEQAIKDYLPDLNNFIGVIQKENAEKIRDEIFKSNPKYEQLTLV